MRKDEPHRRWELDAGIKAGTGHTPFAGNSTGKSLATAENPFQTSRETTLTRKGAAVALATTAPLPIYCVLEIKLADLELAVRRPPPLAQHIACIEERLAADGSVLNPLDYRAGACGPA